MKALSLHNKSDIELLTTEIPDRLAIWDSNAAWYPEFTLHFSSDFLCKTQEGKLPIRTPFQNFRRPQKSRFTTETRRSATKTCAASRSLQTPHIHARGGGEEKKVLIRLHLHVPLPQGRGIASRRRIKHGLNKNAVTNCASQTGVRAVLAEFCVC